MGKFILVGNIWFQSDTQSIQKFNYKTMFKTQLKCLILGLTYLFKKKTGAKFAVSNTFKCFFNV